MEERAQNVVPLKKDTLDSKQYKLWLSRCRTANRLHRKQLVPKWNTAKARYDGDISSEMGKKNRLQHSDVNFLFKDIEDFNASLYYKNPEIDLISRDTQDEMKIRNIENLQQLVNDDIKDDEALKAKIRAGLVDEGLSSLGVFYLDYDYRTKEILDENGEGVPVDGVTGEDGQPIIQQEEIEQKVNLVKLRPDSLIRPPYQTLYNYQDSPYFGFVDICPLEGVKMDESLDPAVVEKLKGKEYSELMDVDKDEIDNKSKEDKNDDLLYVKIYYVWIKGQDKKPLKRLVIADEEGIDQPLGYDDFDRGHGTDGRGYPVHVVALNDCCDGFIPPSEAWILEPILLVLDYIFQKQVSHLRTAKTRTFAKVGKDGLKKTDIFKWISNNDMEVFGVNNLAPGVDIRSLIMQMTDQPLSGDHVQMYELAKRIFDQLSRQPSFAQAAVLEQKKTATESAAIQAEDKSVSAYKIDKFKDFLKRLFYDWAKLRQRNLVGYKQIKVENEDTGEEEVRDVGENEIQGEFNADVNVESFTMPNKELKRRIVKDALADAVILNPLLKEQGNQINAKRLTSEYFQNIEMRNPEELVIPMKVRGVDQQVTEFMHKGVPFNPQEVGGDVAQELARLKQLLADPQIMGAYEQMMAGISRPGSPLVEFGMALEQLLSEKVAPSRPTKGPMGPDMNAEAGMMAGAM